MNQLNLIINCIKTRKMDQITYSQSTLETIMQFKLTLKQILTHSKSNKTTILQLQSLKNIICLSILRLAKQKQQKIARRERISATSNTINQSRFKPFQQQSATWCPSQYCSTLLRNICRNYQKKDNMNRTLHQLQCLNDKITSKYQKCNKQIDQQGQNTTIIKASQINKQLSQLLQSFIRLKQDTCAQYDNLKDLIKTLKVKHNTLKTQLKHKQLTSKSHNPKPQRPIMIPINQNNNQFMLNV